MRAACLLLTVVLAAAAAGEDPVRLPAPAGLSKVFYSPDGLRLVGLGYTGEVTTWDTRTGKQVGRFAVPTPGFGLTASTFTHDGATLAFVVQGADGRSSSVRLHDARTGKETARWRLKELSSALAESPDGNLLAVACGTRVRVFEAASGDERPAVPTPDGQTVAGGLGWTPDGKHLLFPVYTKTGMTELLVCDAGTGDVKRRLPAAATFGGRGFAVTSDGSEVLTLGPPDPNTGQSKLVVYDLTSGKKVRTLGDRAFGVDLAVTPDGKRFVSCDTAKSEIVLGDAATGKVLAAWPKWFANGLAVSPDGNSFAACGTDMTDPNAATQSAMRVRIDGWRK